MFLILSAGWAWDVPAPSGRMSTDEPEPPSPPPLPRRIRLYRHQWAGFVLLALMPALALDKAI